MPKKVIKSRHSEARSNLPKVNNEDSFVLDLSSKNLKAGLYLLRIKTSAYEKVIRLTMEYYGANPIQSSFVYGKVHVLAGRDKLLISFVDIELKGRLLFAGTTI